MKINNTGVQLSNPATALKHSGSARTHFAQKLEQAVSAGKQSDGDDVKLKQACRDMEAVFLNLMLSQMRSTVPKTSLLGDTSKEEIMRSLLDAELTKNMSEAGGIGLADMLYRQLSTTLKLKSQAPR